MGEAVEHGRKRAPAAGPGDPLRPHQGNARSMSAGDLRETVLLRVDQIRGEMVERVQEALNRNNQLAKDLKDYAEFRESINKRLFDFARRLTLIEADLKSAIAAGLLGQMKARGLVEPGMAPAAAQHRGPGHWPLPRQQPARSNSPTGVPGRDMIETRDELAEYQDRPRPELGPVPDYPAIRAEAAEKAKKELPETVSVTDLARYFGVCRNKVWHMATHGELRVIRKGRLMLFPRDEVVQYIRSRGVPRPRRLNYGASGIVEVPSKEGHGDAWVSIR